MLDAVAIAAQSLVGAALGAGDADAARGASAGGSALVGVVCGVGFAVLVGGRRRRRAARCSPPTRPSATQAARGLAVVRRACCRSPGVVFALDGVLIGAGDVRFLRNLTLVAALGFFLPAIWLALRVRPRPGRRLGRADPVHRWSGWSACCCGCGPAGWARGGCAVTRGRGRRGDGPSSGGSSGRMAGLRPWTGGSVVVDKPGGMTSHDVVARMRRLARTRRVGHGGTLDPMATGVLVIGVNRATRLLTYVIGAASATRRRSGSAQSTVTDDAEGEVVAERRGRESPTTAIARPGSRR